MFHVEHFAVRVCFISRLPFWESARGAAGRSRNGNWPGSDGIGHMKGEHSCPPVLGGLAFLLSRNRMPCSPKPSHLRDQSSHCQEPQTRNPSP